MADILIPIYFSVKGVMDVKSILREKKNLIAKLEIHSASSFTTENLSLYINCPTEDPESRHDGRSL